MLILYYKPTCPFCHRVLEMAKNLQVELELKDVSEDEEALSELLARGGKSQVPFLIDTEKTVSMYESSDIIDYMRECAPKGEMKAESKPRMHVGGSTCISCEG
jgi:glutaredoxin 3